MTTKEERVLVILDYSTGTVNACEWKHPKGTEDEEDLVEFFLESHGFSSSNCNWMITSPSLVQFKYEKV